MKVVVAIDSFKGSLSSMEAGNAAKEGILKACSADVVVKPLADGGEGTTEALVEGLGASGDGADEKPGHGEVRGHGGRENRRDGDG